MDEGEFGPCVGVGWVRHLMDDVDAYQECDQPATRPCAIKLDGWGVVVPLCPAHRALWVSDLGSATIHPEGG